LDLSSLRGRVEGKECLDSQEEVDYLKNCPSQLDMDKALVDGCRNLINCTFTANPIQFMQIGLLLKWGSYLRLQMGYKGHHLLVKKMSRLQSRVGNFFDTTKLVG
jgi:hypothetical protein